MLIYMKSLKYKLYVGERRKKERKKKERRKKNERKKEERKKAFHVR